MARGYSPLHPTLLHLGGELLASPGGGRRSLGMDCQVNGITSYQEDSTKCNL